jgi:hypothetical protein
MSASLLSEVAVLVAVASAVEVAPVSSLNTLLPHHLQSQAEQLIQ